MKKLVFIRQHANQTLQHTNTHMAKAKFNSKIAQASHFNSDV